MRLYGWWEYVQYWWGCSLRLKRSLWDYRNYNEKIGKDSIEYYVLKPVCSDSSTLFVPTQNEMLVSRMRVVLSSDEIKDILSQKTDNEIWIDNKAERCEKSRKLFRAAIVWSLLSLSGECTSTVSSSSKRADDFTLLTSVFLKKLKKWFVTRFRLFFTLTVTMFFRLCLQADFLKIYKGYRGLTGAFFELLSMLFLCFFIFGNSRLFAYLQNVAFCSKM